MKEAEDIKSANGRWRILGVLCVAVVLSFSTWFSAAAIAPELAREWTLSGVATAWLTNGVQLGFVIGALLASLINLPIAVICRMATGLALAGVYPPALKLVSTWFVTGRGLAFAGVIGAITAGSSLPHLFRGAISDVQWQTVVGLASLASIISMVIFLFFTREGPYPYGKAVFDPRQIGRVLRDRDVALVNLGYLGHMWELYAMWAWLLAYVTAALEGMAAGDATEASLLTFTAVAAGVVGCFAGGLLSDRFGRTATTAGMMLASGTCALLIGFVFEGPQWLLVLVVVIWGITIIGDSAQFSAAVTELADRAYIGTALSLQMGMGFALTILMIWLMPHLAEWLGGWRWTFSILAVGPFIGAIAMLALRLRPAAARLANGRR